MQPGDLIFYLSQGRWYERLIERATHGPFVHVAVVVDQTQCIAAETRGITIEYFPIPGSPDYAHIQTHALPPTGNPAAALLWANKQVGKHYGWVDILDQCLRVLGSPLYLGRKNALDCSDLAACFAALYSGDNRLMQWVLDNRQEISPNDLARYYGLIK